MNVHGGTTIAAPVEAVWAAYADVEHWPEWTASVTSVEPLGDGALAIGARFRIKQPRLRQMVWEVVDLEPGRSWTWVARSPGAFTSAAHRLVALDASSTRVEQTIEHRGVVGVVVGRMIRRLTRRYLATEAAGLDTRVTTGATAT
jgi:uncharacterized membrane protein